MKILEIITPDETLNEDWKTTGKDLIKKTRRFFKGKPAVAISDEIDEILTREGKSTKRSPELAQAEKDLIAVDAKVKLSGDDRDAFKEVGDALAVYLEASKTYSLHGANPLTVLRKVYANDPSKAPPWLNTTGAKFIELNDESYQALLREYAEAKTQVLVKIKATKTVKPPVTQTDEIVDAIAKQEAWFLSSMSRLKAYEGVFLGSEALKIFAQWAQQRNTIIRWMKAGTGMPPEVAQYFPAIPPDGLPAGKEFLTSTTGDKPESKYTNEQQRYKEAGLWALDKIGSQFWLQVITVGVVGAGTQKFLVSTGGVGGKANMLNKGWRLFSKLFGGAGNDTVSTILRGSTKAGQMLFVDYMAAATDPNSSYTESYASKIATLINALPANLPESLNAKKAWVDMPRAEYNPNINKAVANLIMWDCFGSTEDFLKSNLYNQLKGAEESGFMIITAAWGVIIGLGKLIVDVLTYCFPQVIEAFGEGKSNIPVQNNTKPPSTEVEPAAPKTGDANSSHDQGVLSGDQNTSTNTSPAVVKPEVNPQAKPEAKPPANARKGKVTPSDNGYLDESINESLKKRVAQLMKS